MNKHTEMKELDGGSVVVTYSYTEDGSRSFAQFAFTTMEEATDDVVDFYKGEGDWEGF